MNEVENIEFFFNSVSMWLDLLRATDFVMNSLNVSATIGLGL